MGLFGSVLGSVGNALGISGSGDAGANANRQLAQIASQLRNFTPIRVRSAAGTGMFGPDGVSFDLDPRLSAGAGSLLDFFGGSARKLAEFDEGDATARTLGLLRQRRAEAFEPQLARLESRLMQQGRLGLATGARAANPEMAGFFGAEAMADLEAQLAASEEARRERAGLMGAVQGGLGLAMEASMPSQFMSGLFNAESLRAARDMAAAQIQAGGPKLEFQGASADLAQQANFFGGLGGALFGAAGEAGGFGNLFS